MTGDKQLKAFVLLVNIFQIARHVLKALVQIV